MYSGEPIKMYGTLGKYLPTPYTYDFKSIEAWSMGVCIQLVKNQLLQTS